MNLCAMTLDDLIALQAQLDVIRKALVVLAGQPCNQDEVLLCVDLTPGEVPIITTHWRMPVAQRFDDPADVVIEAPADVVVPDVVADDGPSPGEIARSMIGLTRWREAQIEQRRRDDAVDAFMAAQTAMPAPAQDNDAPRPPFGPVLGPLTEAERAAILQMDADGVPRRDIAARLGRRVQTVALFLDRPAPRAPAAPEPMAQPDPGAEQAQPPGISGGDMAAPVQPVAVIADPVDDAMGGAVIAPEPAAEAGRCGPLPPPDRAVDREIWAHLQALGNAPPFDAGIDLQICEDLGRGLKPDMIAADLGLDTKQVVARFRVLSHPIRDDRDRVRPDGQARLVAELRRRVDWAAGAARGA